MSIRAKITLLLIPAAIVASVVLWPRPAAQPKPVASQAKTAAANPAPALPSPQNWVARIAAAKPSEFPALVREILSKSPSTARDQALAALISDWIKRSPQGLRAFLDTLDVDDDSSIGASFFAALATALPYVSDHAASSPYLSELVSQLVQVRAEEDPAAALAWAEKWLLDDALDEARVTVAGALASESPGEALKLLDKIRSPLRRIEALSAISEGYARNDPKAAREWAEKLPHDAEVATAMNGILSVMAEDDPRTAGTVFQAVQSRIAGKYAKLAAAARLARGLPEHPKLDAQGNEIIDDAGGENAPPTESPDLDQLADSSAVIARGLAKDDPAAALRWADSLPGVLKTGGTRAALTAWAETQPEDAYKYCIAKGWSDAGTFEGIFASWGESDPESAAAAAATVSGDRARAGAISSTVDAWAGQSRDPGDVGQWIASLPDQKDRNTANRALASAIDTDQPKLAWERVMQISNPDDRRGVLASAFASLVANQPAQASAALDQASNLTAEERGRLSRMLDSRLR